MLKLSSFIIEKISIKFNFQKLKKLIDLGFIFIEKIIIKLQKLHHLYFDFYDEMTEKEIKLANISKDDSIMHIGCGPIPATSILLAKKSGAQITSIDKNINTVKQAMSVVSKYGISNRIKVQQADANVFPVDKFDIIIISQGINPYKELLKHISMSMKVDARVIFRTSSSFNGEIAQSDLFIKNLFKVGPTVVHKKNGLLISILLFKKKL